MNSGSNNGAQQLFSSAGKIQQSDISSSIPNVLTRDAIDALLLNTFEAFIIIIDEQGKIHYASENCHEIVNLAADEMKGRSVYDLIPPSHNSYAGEFINKVLRNKNATANLKFFDSADRSSTCLLSVTGKLSVQTSSELSSISGQQSIVCFMKKIQVSSQSMESRSSVPSQLMTPQSVFDSLEFKTKLDGVVVDDKIPADLRRKYGFADRLFTPNLYDLAVQIEARQQVKSFMEKVVTDGTSSDESGSFALSFPNKRHYIVKLKGSLLPENELSNQAEYIAFVMTIYCEESSKTDTSLVGMLMNQPKSPLPTASNHNQHLKSLFDRRPKQQPPLSARSPVLPKVSALEPPPLRFNDLHPNSNPNSHHNNNPNNIHPGNINTSKPSVTSGINGTSTISAPPNPSATYSVTVSAGSSQQSTSTVQYKAQPIPQQQMNHSSTVNYTNTSSNNMALTAPGMQYPSNLYQPPSISSGNNMQYAAAQQQPQQMSQHLMQHQSLAHQPQYSQQQAQPQMQYKPQMMQPVMNQPNDLTMIDNRKRQVEQIGGIMDGPPTKLHTYQMIAVPSMSSAEPDSTTDDYNTFEMTRLLEKMLSSVPAALSQDLRIELNAMLDDDFAHQQQPQPIPQQHYQQHPSQYMQPPPSMYIQQGPHGGHPQRLIYASGPPPQGMYGYNGQTILSYGQQRPPHYGQLPSNISHMMDTGNAPNKDIMYSAGGMTAMPDQRMIYNGNIRMSAMNPHSLVRMPHNYGGRMIMPQHQPQILMQSPQQSQQRYIPRQPQLQQIQQRPASQQSIQNPAPVVMPQSAKPLSHMSSAVGGVDSVVVGPLATSMMPTQQQQQLQPHDAYASAAAATRNPQEYISEQRVEAQRRVEQVRDHRQSSDQFFNHLLTEQQPQQAPTQPPTPSTTAAPNVNIIQAEPRTDQSGASAAAVAQNLSFQAAADASNRNSILERLLETPGAGGTAS